MANFQNANKIKFLPLPYIGMFDLDLLYQTSDIELLYQVLYKINEIAKSQNIVIDNFQKVLEWAKEQIEKYTKEQLEEWLNDGTIEKILMDILKNFIFMSCFNGDNDNEIVQNCLNYAISLNRPTTIIVDRVFTLTETIELNNISTEYNYIKLIGITKESGFLIKSDITVFSSANQQTIINGGYIFENIQFNTTEQQTILFNMDTLIRLTFLHCCFKNFNYVFYSQTKYIQTLRINNCLFIKNNNVIHADNLICYDIVIDKCGFEQQNGQIVYLQRGCNELTISNNTIENCTNLAIYIGGGGICNIINNYFELNDGYIDVSSYQGNFEISNNFAYDNNKTKYFIKLAKNYLRGGLISENFVNNFLIGYWEDEPELVSGYTPINNYNPNSTKTNYINKWYDRKLIMPTSYIIRGYVIFDLNGANSSSLASILDERDNVSLTKIDVSNIGEIDTTKFTVRRYQTCVSLLASADIRDNLKNASAYVEFTVN